MATPTFLAERARELADAHDSLSVETLDRAGIESLGMGAFAAVAQGTYEEPQLIVLRYEGGGVGPPRLGFVGKAVTFDTGGISIKPAAKMQEMKFDMSGGAAVIEAIGRDRGARPGGADHRASCPRPRTCRAGARSSRATSSPP